MALLTRPSTPTAFVRLPGRERKAGRCSGPQKTMGSIVLPGWSRGRPTPAVGWSVADADSPVAGRRRLFAIIALLAVAAVVVEVVDFFIRNAGYLLVGLIGLGLSVAGGWRLVTRRGFRRVLALVGLLAGVGTMITMFVKAAIGADRPLVQVLVFVGLIAIAFGSAREALTGDDRRLDEHHRRSAADLPGIRCCSATPGPGAGRSGASGWWSWQPNSGSRR